TLGDAATAFTAVRAKIEDYFTRCKVAAYDSRAAAALAGQEPALIALGDRALSDRDAQLAQLPLAAIDPAVRLPLAGALNPAWQDRMRTFVAAVVVPILGARDRLSPDDLAAIAGKLAPYDAWLAGKPATKVDALSDAWIAKLSGPELRKQLAELI